MDVDIKARVKELEEQRRELEERAQRAGVRQSELEGMRRDRDRLEKRAAYFAGFGDERVSVPYRMLVPVADRAVELDMEPLKTKESGSQLAAKVRVSLRHLRAEITRVEAEVQALLDAPPKR